MAEHKNGDSRFDDLTAYPILTDDISGDVGGTSGGTSAAGGSAPIGKVVQNALRNVLAWKPRTGDPTAFVSALTQAFDLTTIEGHVEWKWNQRSYAIDADLGKVTGAQASIYARAKSFLDLVMPLIQGFTPLNPAFIQDDIDAIRAVVINGVSELVNELGQEGGPRVSRVDQLFRLLLGPKGGRISSHETTPLGLDRERLGGQLGLMRSKFGFDRYFVNTIPDEEMLTNFLILVDGVQGLLFTWTTQKKSFERRGNDVFLGTQAVLLSRSLGVIAESIQDACIVMDSVFLGIAERQVTELHLGPNRFGGDSSIFLGDLLSWIEDFATTEGPLLINEGGLLGVRETFVPTVEELERLTRRAAAVARHRSHNPTPNFHQPRVVVALETLANQLGECLRLSADLIPERARIKSISPSSAADKTMVEMTIAGHHFKDIKWVRLERTTHPFDVIGPVRAVIVPAPDVASRGPLAVGLGRAERRHGHGWSDMGDGDGPGDWGNDNDPDPMGTPSGGLETLTATFDLTNKGAGYGTSTWDVVITDKHGISEVRPRSFEIAQAGTPEVTITMDVAPTLDPTTSTVTAQLTAEAINCPNPTFAWTFSSKSGGTAQFDDASNQTVVATLDSADTYEFTVTVTTTPPGGPTVNLPPVSLQVAVKQQLTSISVEVTSTPEDAGGILSSTSARIGYGHTAILRATSQDQFGKQMAYGKPHFHWTMTPDDLASPAGSIATSGPGAPQCTYTAPATGDSSVLIQALILIPGSSPLVSDDTHSVTVEFPL